MISIIVPIRFRPDLTRVCIDSVFSYTPGKIEVILVIDGHDKEMEDLVCDYSQARIIRHDEPNGYCKAINSGFKVASSESEFVILLNSDTVVTPGWSEALIAPFATQADVGLTAPRLLENQQDQSIEHRNEYEKEVRDVKGAVMCFRRSVCDELVSSNEKMGVQGNALLDERFGFGGGDDNDICFRVKKLGYKILVCYKSFVYHYNSASFREFFNHDAPYSRRYASGQLSKFKAKWGKELEMKPFVMVAIPCVDGFIHHQLAGTLCSWTKSPFYIVRITPITNRVPLDNARNYAVKLFLESTCDYLLFIDSDIIPPTNCLERLLESDKDIICPLCFIMSTDDKGNRLPMPVALRANGKGYRVFSGRGIQEVDAISGGCFLARREVYERIRRPFSFTYDDDGCVVNSEDVVFSKAAKENGFRLYLDFGCICGHVKKTDLAELSRSFAIIGNANGG